MNKIIPNDQVAFAEHIDNGEYEFIGFVPNGTKKENVEWPDWVNQDDDNGIKIYRKTVCDFGWYLEMWFKDKLKSLKLTT